MAQGTYRRVFSWGLDRYGQMGAGGRATAVGKASEAFNCKPVQVPGLNWAVLSQIGAQRRRTRAARFLPKGLALTRAQRAA